MRVIRFLVLLMVGLLVACAPEVLPKTTGAEPKLSPTLASRPATPLIDKTAAPGETSPVTTTIPDDAVIVFHRSGGFAGLDEQWRIYPEGRIEKLGGEQQQIEPEEVRALLETIRAADFFGLNASYVPQDTCCDRFTYTITVELDDQVKTVSTIDASPTQPDQLTTVLSAIADLLFR